MRQPANSLLLADGTLLENSSCGASGRDLWCWVTGKTMAECLAIFSDPEITQQITVAYNTSRVVYTGYIKLLAIILADDQTEPEVRIRMTWPEDGEHSIVDIDDLNDEEPPH